MAAPSAEFSPLLQSALAAIRSATEGMSEEQLLWHPEGKWSSAGILEHLSLAYSLTTDRMKRLLQQALPAVRKSTFKEWIGRVIVLRFSHIPKGRKAPEPLSPRGMKPAEARLCIEEQLSELDQSVTQCEERFGSQQKILVHPGLGPLTASDWRKFHCVHTLHHMKQIQKNREIAVIG
jgi:hypothetical protein